ncbi:MAG: alanine--tRNA ligase-related protein [Candidatus Bathyarchaeota archaeon]|nr:alanine--tRNA ligase-related protein [Candidatus Bathyarchaeota archaeon]
MPELSGMPPTRLLYYENAYVKEFDTRVIKILKMENGETGVVLDETAFFPGGGGQPRDTGLIENDGMHARVVRVKRHGEIIIHFIDQVSGEIREGDKVRGVIDWNRRYRLMRVHTSAHLMSQAIRQALDKPVEIVSSGMDLEKTRLDFTHKGSTRELFPQIESIANNVVKENRTVKIRLMPRNEGEEYVKKFHESLKTLPPQVSEVRIVEIEGWHACACGGTHVKSTSEIREVKLLSRSSKGKGIERIESTVQKP